MVTMPKVPIARTVDAIFKGWELNEKDWRRAHLGASVIGHECRRHIYYHFRWACAPDFPGRMLRLFDRGFREEPVFLQDLRRIGCKTWDEDPVTKRQFTISHFGGHFGGSCDGVVLGLLESPKTPHLLEFKTAKHKTFTTVSNKGVQTANYRHYIQMQIYMEGLKLTRAAYFVVNKDNDHIYMERVNFNPQIAKTTINLACDIIFNKIPPVRISDDACYYVCRMCQYNGICHAGESMVMSCRTCEYGTPVPKDCLWDCKKHEKKCTVPEQKLGCKDHKRLEAK